MHQRQSIGDVAAAFRAMYATTGRPSIPPEHLLRGLLRQVLYSVRSERMLMDNSSTTSC